MEAPAGRALPILVPRGARAPLGRGYEAARRVWNAAIDNPAEADRHTRWARDLHASLIRSVTSGAYVNFLGNEGQER